MSFNIFSKEICTSDTIQIIKYNNHYGLFADSAATQRITRKLLLADTLSKINLIQEQIITRDKIQRDNCILIENSFNKYIANSKEESKLIAKQNQIVINNKNKTIWTYRLAILGFVFVRYVLPLIKL